MYVEALFHFLDRRARALVFVLEVGRDRPLVLLQQLQHFAHRRVACAPLHVRPLIALAVLDVQVRDVRVVLAEVRDRVVIRGREVADVEIDLEILRHRQRRREAFGRRELVRVLDVRMVVHRDDHLVLLGERRDPLRRRQRARRRDEPGAERPRDLEAAIDFGLGEAVVEAVVVGANGDLRAVELLADGGEVFERRLEAPLPKFLARHLLATARLEHRRPQLAVAQAALGERLDDDVGHVAARGPGQLPETVGLRAERDAGRRFASAPAASATPGSRAPR